MTKRMGPGVLLVALTLAISGQMVGVSARPRDDTGPATVPMDPMTVAQGMMGQGMMGQGTMGPGTMYRPAPPAPGAGGSAIFRSQCAPCHSLQASSSGLPGPSLHGLFGRKAGTVAGFNYSTAMRDSGVVWNERTLDQYIAAPQTFIPGDIMPFPGLADKNARQRLIAYLKAATG